MFVKTATCVFALTFSAAPLLAADEADVLKGAVYPINLGSEKTRFLKAAGVDNELEQGEVEKAADAGFIRVYDKWATLKPFDGNNDGKINWPEAENYRKALRKAVIAKYDANKSDGLEGEELASANRDLAAGKLPKLDAGATAIAAAPAPTPAPRNNRPNFEQNRAERIAQFDKDGDGQLNEAERLAAGEAQREEFNARLIAENDRDGDGKLSEVEKLAMPPQQQMALKLQDLGLRHFDEDGDGKFGDAEQQQILAFGQKLQGLGKQWELNVVDLNKDGQITSEERQQMQQRFQAVGINMLPKAQAWADTDGDGTASQQEWQGLAQRVAKTAETQVETWTKKFDADSNGKLSATERDALVEGIREDADQRYKRHDADGDGQLGVGEWQTFLEEIAGEWGAKPSQFQ